MTDVITAPEEPATDRSDAALDEREAFGERLFGAMLGSLELLSTQLGIELGLYPPLRTEALDASTLAARAGIDARYAREWLEQQAVAGILEVDDVTATEDRRRYQLPEAQAEVLLDKDSPWYFGAGGDGLLGVALPFSRLVDAYRTGAGVSYADYGREIRHAIQGLNRPMFVNELASVWLPAMADVHERLQAAPPARVLDLGCGTGHSAVAMAAAYPRIAVRGVDLDTGSIAEARTLAASAGLADRVSFIEGDAAQVTDDNTYELVTIFEALHDMGDPVGALRAARQLLAPGGSILLADERVEDRFTAPADEPERLQYGFSVLHCLPATLAEDPVVAHGTVLRAPTVVAWAEQAGFTSCEVLDIDNLFWRFYRLDP